MVKKFYKVAVGEYFKFNNNDNTIFMKILDFYEPNAISVYGNGLNNRANFILVKDDDEVNTIVINDLTLADSKLSYI